MERIAGTTCPRCGGKIPSDEHEGQYPGALSRLDNATEICSHCGLDEALRFVVYMPDPDYTGWAVSPKRKKKETEQQ